MEVKGKKSQLTQPGARRRQRQREDWAEGALQALTASGIDAVRAEVLVTDVGVTEGSFCWHVNERPALLEAMLQEWEATRPGVAAAVPEQATPTEQMARYLELVTAYAAEDQAAMEQAILAGAQKDAAIGRPRRTAP